MKKQHIKINDVIDKIVKKNEEWLDEEVIFPRLIW